MKKWLPWILVVVFAAWVVASLRTKPETGFQTRQFGRLPVLLNGRVQPWDSVARNSLLELRTKQTVALDHGQRLTADQWLLEVLMKPEIGDTRKVFRIDNIELLGMLNLPDHEKYFSYSQLQPHFADINKEAERIDKIESSQRSAFERQLMKLYSGMTLYQRLKLSLRPQGSDDFVAELKDYEKAIEPGVAAVQASQAGKSYDKEAYDRILQYLAAYQDVARYAYALAVPPVGPKASREDWKNLGTSLMEAARGSAISPAVNYYAAMITAYRANNPNEFNKAVQDYHQWLSGQFTPELKKGAQESFFNFFQPFYKALVIYVAALLCALLFWFLGKEWLRLSGFYLVGLAWIIHTFGLGFRMYLEGRPPVTNLYSSAIFIGWGAVILGMVLERFYRDGIGTVVGSMVGFVTLIIAHHLALAGDTMEMLRAVLDTNFWLATHVVVITLGYASTFVAGFLAIIYIVLGFFTRRLAQPMASGTAESALPVGAAARGQKPNGKKPANTATVVPMENTGKVLGRMVYGIICFATLFSFVGTVLGGIWADQSWGRFWGWDPKENGALLIVLWNAIILHARWGGMVRERGIMNLAVFGNIVTSFSWFGVNMLGIGLHSYGFMDAAFKWLVAFIVSQVAIIGLGCLPLRMWKSFQVRVPDKVGRSKSDGQRPGKAAPAAT